MLFTTLDQIIESPFDGFVSLASFIVALVVAISFHEFSHAVLATGLGDPTARRLGRVSLSPKAHLDPLGTAMIILAGFGWGKPVPVNPVALRLGGRAGMAVVAGAGPIANILVAFLVAVTLDAALGKEQAVGFYLFNGRRDEILPYLLGSIVFWNLLLAAFNLIPIAPLDGFKVALGVLPRPLSDSYARLERYGPFVLLALILLDLLIPGGGLLSLVVTPMLNALANVVVGRHVV